ncbi:MAG: amidohydrolase family protein [Bacteroidia bacterium]|nr:amidohydrolase family protein [Bacteroidia bacterium]
MNRIYKLIVTLALSLTAVSTYAQENTFPTNGVNTQADIYYAFTHAKIYIDPTTIVTDATLLIRNGVVEQVGTNMALPTNTVIINCTDKWIYPSFIDAFAPNIGIAENKFKGSDDTQYESNKKGAYYWNETIQPEYNAAENYSYVDAQADELRKLGFGTINTFNANGIVRGTSVVTTLAQNKEYKTLVKENATMQLSFNKGVSRQEYPTSLMGSIALLRQALYDAQWYKNETNKKETNLSLQALNYHWNIPFVFDASDKQNIVRANTIAKEFNKQFIIKATGDEYQRIQDIKALNTQLIATVHLPTAYDVEDAADAENVSLSELKHWELAVTNLATLEKNEIVFALSTQGLKEKKEFWNNLRKYIAYGLTETTALKALLTVPAEQLQISNKVGSLNIGRIANFIITNGNIFNAKTVILNNYTQGEAHSYKALQTIETRGKYVMDYDSKIQFILSGTADSPKIKLTNDTSNYKAIYKIERSLITLNYDVPTAGTIRLTGVTSPDGATLNGYGYNENGKQITWKATRTQAYQDTVKVKSDTVKVLELGHVTYPMMAYGFDTLPKTKTYHIKNATIWTNESEGIVTNTDVILQNGKIKAIGKNIVTPQGADTINATGMHLTAGIIDEHSHIAVSGGVNEGAQAVTAEVSIADVVNADDINIYRQLSGGVVASQLLHGSANVIGGQSAIIKLRWGASAEQLKIAGADKFIKCALGENVKQSNWGDKFTKRFPQTRMGVEQTFIDAFTRAKEYERKKTQSNYRKDLECEVLLEIVNKQRFITCHSYLQSEVNMLMHVADSFGFKINTFTHILEGYKIADKLKAHGANASTFSDWWAYKMEVQDAIPYNGALLHKMGVNTSFNSDDAEMARRLNQEAGKAVKYGNVSEEEALKFVTLNPAKMLHLDAKMGSIKIGKDADVVLWNTNPLSVYARAQKTFVDGILCYDITKDAQLRSDIAYERNRIIQKLITLKNSGTPVIKTMPKKQLLYDCESIEQDYIAK